MIDMAWWRGQYIVALVRTHTVPAVHSLRVYGSGTIHTGAQFCGADLPPRHTPRRLCVGASGGGGRVAWWVAVAAEVWGEGPPPHTPAAPDATGE